MANENVRNRYVSDGAGVVPPARLLVMLYDRLVLDLEQGAEAIRLSNIALANDKLVHAQSIVLELHSALDMAAWDGAESLAQLYMWFTNELAQANVKKDARIVEHCLVMVRELQEAWKQAYEQTLATQHSAPVGAVAPSSV